MRIRFFSRRNAESPLEFGAEIPDATQIPREGDLIWLQFGGGEEKLYRITAVNWDTALIPDTRTQHTEVGVLALLEATDED
jgi:hypothetical protein